MSTLEGVGQSAEGALRDAIAASQNASGDLAEKMTAFSDAIPPFYQAHERLGDVVIAVSNELRYLHEENARLRAENDVLRSERDGATIDELIPQVGGRLHNLEFAWQRGPNPVWGVWWKFIDIDEDDIGRPWRTHSESGGTSGLTFGSVVAAAKEKLAGVAK